MDYYGWIKKMGLYWILSIIDRAIEYLEDGLIWVQKEDWIWIMMIQLSILEYELIDILFRKNIHRIE